MDRRLAVSGRIRVALVALAGWCGAACSAAEPAAPAPPPARPVITQILGTSIRYNSKLDDKALAAAVRDIADKGFTVSWDASPASWAHDLLNRPKRLAHIRRVAKLIHAKGMGVAFGFHWYSLLPRSRNKAFKTCPWAGETLDPTTGALVRKNWDFGSEAARQEFIRRSKALFAAVEEPFEMFYCDEVILAKAGPNAHRQRISTYWTSPTFSAEALKSFRAYLAKAGYAGSAVARFPVTTRQAPKSDRANAGLPAVPITDANRDRLTPDNNWPDSPLWKHWYAWRENLYAAWLDGVTTAAYETWGHRPQWLGCLYEMPWHWAVTGLGQNLDKIAALPHVDYVVAGYLSGARFAAVQAAAKRAGKRWGIQVELCRYGQAEGRSPDEIRRRFKRAVEAGADTVTCYAGSNFRRDRMAPSPRRRKTGLYYMPVQTAAWADCIAWLRAGRGYRRHSPAP